MQHRKLFLILTTLLLLIVVSSKILSWFYPPARLVPATTPVTILSTQDQVRFAVIGDFGQSGTPEGEVASLVKDWKPDFIVSTGDNNYPDGSMLTIDKNVGRYYHEFIGRYSGSYGEGAAQNRFFPALGNHDWHSMFCFRNACRGAYFGYFSLPGNERYYDFVWGPVQFFILDSDKREPDGTSQTSVQALWLKRQLETSTAVWKLVVSHHPPYSSGDHGSNQYIQWTFSEWGASAVLSGHDHLYERILMNDIPYFVNGSGGGGLYKFNAPILGSQVRFNQDHGAMLVEGTAQTLTFYFISRGGDVIDRFVLQSKPR